MPWSIRSASSPFVIVSLLLEPEISTKLLIESSSVAFLGWSVWSEWSTCNNDSERVRTRTCLLKKPNSKECQGEEREVRQCYLEPLTKTDETILSAGSSSGAIWTSLFILMAMCIIGLSSFIVYQFKFKKLKHRPIPQSPHFSVVPNQYSSLPTKDVSLKAPSDDLPVT